MGSWEFAGCGVRWWVEHIFALDVYELVDGVGIVRREKGDRKVFWELRDRIYDNTDITSKKTNSAHRAPGIDLFIL